MLNFNTFPNRGLPKRELSDRAPGMWGGRARGENRAFPPRPPIRDARRGAWGWIVPVDGRGGASSALLEAACGFNPLTAPFGATPGGGFATLRAASSLIAPRCFAQQRKTIPLHSLRGFGAVFCTIAEGEALTRRKAGASRAAPLCGFPKGRTAPLAGSRRRERLAPLQRERVPNKAVFRNPFGAGNETLHIQPHSPAPKITRVQGHAALLRRKAPKGCGGKGPTTLQTPSPKLK